MGLFSKFRKGLKKTRDEGITAKVDEVIETYDEICDDLFDELEEVLIMGDVGMQTAERIISDLKEKIENDKITEVSEVRETLKDIVAGIVWGGSYLKLRTKPSVILVIGVNGVGKTTTCVNMAAALGAKGKKTLLIDVDPQGNSTSGVGIDKSDVKYSTYNVLIGEVAARAIMIETEFKNLYLLPANMNLAGAELELAELDDRNSALKKAISTLVMEFDYIIIDCPPSLGLLSINALVAADTLIVPLQCEYYALEGLSQLVATVRTIKQHYNEHLQLEGVLFTMYDSRLKLTNQVVDEVNKYFPGKSYKTMIPRSVKIAEAPSFGEPVIYYEKYSKPSFAYKKFVDEFLKQQ